MIEYEATAEELTNRILALVPSHPEILEIKDVFDLFKIEGFKCDDIAPSWFQAQWSLAQAKKRANKSL